MNHSKSIGCELVSLTSRGDARGSLVAIEGGQDIPFEIARAYYLFGTEPNVHRGLHAHRALWQCAVAVSGSCLMTLNDGKETCKVTLNDPTVGIMIPPMVWHEMSDFTANCVLLVLADAHYDESDYVRRFDDFLQLVKLAEQ